MQRYRFLRLLNLALGLAIMVALGSGWADYQEAQADTFQWMPPKQPTPSQYDWQDSGTARSNESDEQYPSGRTWPSQTEGYFSRQPEIQGEYRRPPENLDGYQSNSNSRLAEVPLTNDPYGSTRYTNPLRNPRQRPEPPVFDSIPIPVPQPVQQPFPQPVQQPVPQPVQQPVQQPAPPYQPPQNFVLPPYPSTVNRYSNPENRRLPDLGSTPSPPILGENLGNEVMTPRLTSPNDPTLVLPSPNDPTLVLPSPNDPTLVLPPVVTPPSIDIPPMVQSPTYPPIGLDGGVHTPGQDDHIEHGETMTPQVALFPGARILARVGATEILASEVNGAVNELVEVNKDRIPPGSIDQQREMITKQLLKQKIEMKLIYQDALRTIPRENLDRIEENLSEEFEKSVVPKRIQAAGVEGRPELVAKLRQLGSSLDREKRAFVERTLAQQWIQQAVKKDDEITHQDMLDFYREHLADYQFSARTRWEQLTVLKSKHPDRFEAWRLIATMGNDVVEGQPFPQVAQARSEGPTASNGGQHDWTTRGALVSKLLDESIFGLPVGRMSRILEDEQGFHIVRVIERHEAGRKPFLEAQVGIRETIRKQRRSDQIADYLEKLKKQIPVWTVFDTEPAMQSATRQPSSFGIR